MRGTASPVMDRGIMTTIRAIACLAVLALAGCVILPLPIPPTGTAVDSEVAAFDLGSTTRAQVHRTFGKPNVLASDHLDVWRLERDPAHLWMLLVIAAGPAGGTETEMRTGGSLSYRVAVAYDADGKMSGWRWSRSRDGQTASSDFAVGGPPFEPLQVVQWNADWVLRSPDGELLLLDLGSYRRLRVDVVSEIDGTIAGSMTGDGRDCGVLVPFNFAGRDVPFGWSGGKLVSVPAALKPDALPCEWGTSAGADFGGVPLDWFPTSRMLFPARLVGELVVLRDPVGTVNIVDLRGRLLASIEGEWSVSHAAANDGSTRLLLRLLAPSGKPAVWLFDRNNRDSFELGKLSAATAADACYPGLPESSPAGRLALAMSSDGKLAALRCSLGVELWSLPVAHEDAERLRILTLPVDLIPHQLAFSLDGSRLVAAQPGIVVWRASDWQIEAFRRQAGRIGLGVEVDADGSGMATTNGYWRLLPPEVDALLD